MDDALLSTVFGFTSSMTWGAGDFAGGIATKQLRARLVVLLAHCVGLVLFVLCALLFGEVIPTTNELLIGAIAGVIGMVGLLAFYKALAIGRMGIASPLAALVSTLLPIIIAFFQIGLPATITLIGMVVALVAILILSISGEDAENAREQLILGIVAGLGFGSFFVLIAEASTNAVFWPLVSARTASILSLTLMVTWKGQWQRVNRQQILPVVLAGMLDACGNAFFVLAAQFGRLDIAATLSSLYPASTILLARIVLKEKLTNWQLVGVGLALVALLLIT